MEESVAISSGGDLAPKTISSRKSVKAIKSDFKWDYKKSESSVKSGSVKIGGKSSTKLEEKFKRYVSEGDMVMRTLSIVSDDQVSIFENMCDSTHLLARNTESFKCLAQLLLSSSSLAKNRLFLFPPLEDPGISLAFNFEEAVPINDIIGEEKYKRLCQNMEIVPISRIIKSLETDTLDLKYYGLTIKQIKALTEAMKGNGIVQNLILQDNWLTAEMVQMISDMLVENMALQHLSLYECRIGVEGAQKLGEALSSIQTLKSLDLSFNDLGDNGLLALRDGLCENSSIKKLNISHNNITEDSGETMEKILLENKPIEDLNLSWNGFFTAQGNKKLFSGLMKSDRIKNLNLAWNGIGIVPAVRPLIRYLRKSVNLEELDLSNNRLVGASLRKTRGAINKNHSLQVLKIGNNIYAPEEAHFLLTMLAGKAKDPLYYLDMENTYINKESKVVLNKVRNLGKTVIIGGILSNYIIHGPNPKKLLYERCRYILMKPKKAKAKKDFGHFILSLPDKPISPEDFKKELKKQKVKKLDKDLVQAVMNLFTNKKKQVDCPELVKDYMTIYPETKLPPPKPKKGKKGKKGRKVKEIDPTQEEKEIKVHDLEKVQTEDAPSVGDVPPTQEEQAVVESGKSISAAGVTPRTVSIAESPAVGVIPRTSSITESPEAGVIPRAASITESPAAGATPRTTSIIASSAADGVPKRKSVTYNKASISIIKDGTPTKDDSAKD